MRSDIEFPTVEEVYMAITKEESMWRVYLINRSEYLLDTILITSKGYGEKNGEKQRTSTMRHAIPKLEKGEYALIEPIDPEVFHLTNEYWLSYYIGEQIYDKKYLFLPDTIRVENLSKIDELDFPGVLHR